MYPLEIEQFAMENGHLWPCIVSFPIENGDFPVRYLSHYQRVCENIRHLDHYLDPQGLIKDPLYNLIDDY